MDAFYLSDYFNSYLKNIKDSLKKKNVIIILASGLALSMIISLFLKIANIFFFLPGPLSIAIFSLTVTSTASMLIFDRKEYINALLDRTTYLLKNKTNRMGYICIASLVFLGLILCFNYKFYFVLSVGALFTFMPCIVSVFFSAALNSTFRALKYDLRMGSDYLEILLSNVGIAYMLISILSLVIGGL